jgi:hypothetical protein
MGPLFVFLYEKYLGSVFVCFISLLGHMAAAAAAVVVTVLVLNKRYARAPAIAYRDRSWPAA